MARDITISRGRSPEWECRQKRVFHSPAAAERAARSMRRKSGADTKGVSPYRCGFCRKWHIGHGWHEQRLPPSDGSSYHGR